MLVLGAVLVLMILLNVGVASADEMQGSGTEDDPYIIKTVEDLNNIRNDVTAHYKLANDIDLTGVEWQPIGFQGVLDGNGHVIRNLTLESSNNYIGLFSSVGKAEIKNLGIENFNIKGSKYVGALVGYVDWYSKLTNCYVKDSTVKGSESVGGLTGYVDWATITQCYATNINIGSAPKYVGGLIGRGYKAEITQCYVDGITLGNTLSDYVGGFIGYAVSGNISECYATNVKVTGRNDVGGFIGDNTNGNTTSNCFVVGGSVTGNGNRAGGFAGSSPVTSAPITNCYAAIVCSGKGFVGWSTNNVITSCFWDGDICVGKTDDYAAKKSHSEMLQKSTYTLAGWDFDTVWDIQDGISYPWLRNLPIPEAVGAKITLTVEDLNAVPSSISLFEGESKQITAIATMSDGSTVDVTDKATYVSANPNIATVSSNGLVTGVSEGSTTVTFFYEGKTVSVPVTVSAGVQSITVSPASFTKFVGDTVQLTVIATFPDGSTVDVTNSASYESSNNNIASVSNTGLVTGVNAGTVTITVSFGGKTATVTGIFALPVAEVTVDSIDITPNPLTIPLGGSEQLTVTANMSDGTTVDVTNLAEYQGSDESIIQVASNGKVTGVGEGTTTITASYEDKTATAEITVVKPTSGGDDTGSGEGSGSTGGDEGSSSGDSGSSGDIGGNDGSDGQSGDSGSSSGGSSDSGQGGNSGDSGQGSGSGDSSQSGDTGSGSGSGSDSGIGDSSGDQGSSGGSGGTGEGSTGDDSGSTGGGSGDGNSGGDEGSSGSGDSGTGGDGLGGSDSGSTGGGSDSGNTGGSGSGSSEGSGGAGDSSGGSGSSSSKSSDEKDTTTTDTTNNTTTDNSGTSNGEGSGSRDNDAKVIEIIAGDRILTMYLNNPTYTVKTEDGTTVAKTLDVAPFAKEGVTLVPVRGVFESFDALVKWLPETRQVIVSKGDNKIVLKINSKTAMVNGVPAQLLQPAQIVNNRTFIPLRFISENLNSYVQYEHETKKIDISIYDDQEQPQQQS